MTIEQINKVFHRLKKEMGREIIPTIDESVLKLEPEEFKLVIEM